jgi:hypothetical protein
MLRFLLLLFQAIFAVGLLACRLGALLGALLGRALVAGVMALRRNVATRRSSPPPPTAFDPVIPTRDGANNGASRDPAFTPRPLRARPRRRR